VAGTANGPPDAFHVSAKGVEVGASEHGLSSLVYAWNHTLDWAGDHPLITLAVLGVFSFWLYLRHVARIEKDRMKLAYHDARIANQSPSLPLPPPGRAPTIGRRS